MLDLRGLTDEQLLARLGALVGEERECLGDLIEHLMEVDRRDNILDRAYSSLYDYCRRKLGYSEQAAFGRIRAARAARDYPEVLDKIRSGALHLDAIIRLYPVLKAENAGTLLTKASHATSREVMKIAADARPAGPRLPDSVRPLSSQAPPPGELFAQAHSPQEIIPPPQRMKFEFEADEQLLVKIERLKGLLRHKYPFARFEELFKEAADALLDKIDPERRAGLDRRPRSASGVSRTRRVPESVRRIVWQRDGGRCAYVAPDGRRCESRDALQYDHKTPYALGGASDDPANIRLLCRPHNQRLARKKFGPRPPRPPS